MADEPVKILAGLLQWTPDRDIKKEDGTILAKAGQTIVIVPETFAKAVFVDEKTTLADWWNRLSKSDHTHSGYETALAGYQAQLIRATGRITALESAAQTAKQEIDNGDI